MTPSSLDDALVRPDPAAVAAAVAAARERGPDRALDAEAVREARAARPAPPAVRHDVRLRDVPTAGAVTPVPVRVIGPARPVAVQVVAHSSGWCLGGPEQEDVLADALAAAPGVTSVSVGYRLAPEHPFPAGADDVYTVAAAILDGALLDGTAPNGTAPNSTAPDGAAPDGGPAGDGGPGRGIAPPGVPVLLGGASAGAHLTLLAALRLRDERPDAFGRIAGLALRYGCYDLGGTPSLRASGPDALVVTPLRHHSMTGHAFGRFDDAERRHPSRSPLYADLRGLPPVRIDVGDRDPLLDDSLFLAARLGAAGVPVDLAVWAGCTHSFDALDPRLAADLAARLTAWTTGTLSRT